MKKIKLVQIIHVACDKGTHINTKLDGDKKKFDDYNIFLKHPNLSNTKPSSADSRYQLQYTKK